MSLIFGVFKFVAKTKTCREFQQTRTVWTNGHRQQLTEFSLPEYTVTIEFVQNIFLVLAAVTRYSSLMT